METLDPSPAEPATDPDVLLQRVGRQRDRASFAALFACYAPRLGGFFARAGLDAAVRDELVQEVMLRVWRSAEQFDPHRASAATWIYAIARNARIDYLRRPAGVQRPDPLDPAWVDALAPDPESTLARQQRAQHVRAALRDLPPEQAQVLEAAYFDQKTLAAIANECGLALGTVKSRVRLAFQRLRGALDETS